MAEANEEVYQCCECMFMSTDMNEVITHMKQDHGLCLEEDDNEGLEVESACSLERPVSTTELPAEPARPYSWSHALTLQLISLVKEHEALFETTMKKIVWQKIASKLNTNAVTGVMCDAKWKGLKSTYKAHKDHHKQSGNNRLRKFEFFDAMDDATGHKPEVNPIAVISNKRGLTLAKSDSPTPSTPPGVDDDLRDDDEVEEENFGAGPSCKPDTPPYTSAFTRKRAKLSVKTGKTEEGINRRHADCMARQDKFLDLFANLVQKM